MYMGVVMSFPHVSGASKKCAKNPIIATAPWNITLDESVTVPDWLAHWQGVVAVAFIKTDPRCWHTVAM